MCEAIARIRAVSLAMLVAVLAGCAATGEGTRMPVQDTAVVVSPAQVEQWVLQGLRAYEAGQPGQAIAAWQKVLRAEPERAAVRNNLALLLTREARFQEAEDLLQQGIEMTPEVAHLHFNLAVISELYLLDLNKALNHYRRFQALSGQADEQVASWIVDLERRVQ